MELTDDNLRSLAQYLQQTLSPDPSVRRPAEKFLESIEGNQNYGLLLLQLVDKAELDITIRIAGSIVFKNYVQRNWPLEEDGAERIHEADRLAIKFFIKNRFVKRNAIHQPILPGQKQEEDGTERIHEADRLAIKSALVGLMLRSPAPVQKQLSSAVSAVGKHDFPDKWPTLITEMVEKFATGDFHVINGVLQTAHSLFKRYRHEFKSEKLWLEIKFVLERFAEPLTNLFLATLDLRAVHANNPAALGVIYSSLLLVCKIFHSLNAQDLPEFFEDHMNIWMPKLLELLQAKVPQLDTDDDNEPGVVEKVRAEAVECGALYALKYGEEFAPHGASFVTAAWSTLVDAGPQPKYDQLVSGALSLLSNMALKNMYRGLFEDPATQSSICEKVIIPNMEFRELDQELFEDNPEEYMRRDIEGSDVDTRRRAACDLVKVLSIHFEEKIFQIFGQYVTAMLARHASAPDGSQWRSKDAALFLVTSLSERGRTEKAGVTSSSALVDLTQFYIDNILPDLASPNINALPVLKADAIKYVITFRSLLREDQILATFPYLIGFLSAESAVVCSYAACCLEKLMMIVGGRPETSVHTPALLMGLSGLLQRPTHEENDHAMKCIGRTLAVQREACVPVLGVLLPQLAQTLAKVTKNPSRPNFNHFLFESISLSIKIVCKSSPAAIDSFEDVLFPIFQEILQQEVQEFMPYVFQMLSLLLEQRITTANSCGGSTEDVGGPYLGLVGCLLAPPLWERPANVRPLVRLLCGLATAQHRQLVRDNRLNGMLGVFQKLIASKAHDHEGFYLIQCLIKNIPEEVMQPYLKQIISLVFQRLTTSKTTKYLRGLIPFLAFYSVRYGASNLVDTLDAAQPNLFGLYCERVLVPELQKVSGPHDKKLSAVGCVKLLCECPAINQPGGRYQGLWAPILQAVISLLELPSDVSSLPDDHWIDVEEPVGYQAAYCQLSSTRSSNPDPLPHIVEVRQFLAESLDNFNKASQGQLPSLLQSVAPDHRSILETYLQTYHTPKI